MNTSTSELYYRETDDTLLQWEVGYLRFRGKTSKIFGIAWLESLNGKLIGTPLENDQFMDKMIQTGFIYIGEV